MITEKEIIDALTLLKSVCEENNGHCNRCMLRNGCGFAESYVIAMMNTMTL